MSSEHVHEEESFKTLEEALKVLFLEREKKIQDPPEELQQEVMAALSFLELLADLGDLFTVKLFKTELEVVEAFSMQEEEE